MNGGDVGEFKGQIVGILEDMLDEKEASIDNDERDEALAEGEDLEGCAIIYGTDYDVVADPVEMVITSYGLRENTITDETVKDQVVDVVMEGCRDIITKAEFPDGKGFTDEDYKDLETKIRETFTNWELFA